MSRRFSLILIFMIGALALIYEIYSMRVLFMFYIESTKAASIAISAFLGGLAFSSILFGWFCRDKSETYKIRTIFALQLVSAMYGYTILRDYMMIPGAIDFVIAHFENETLQSFVRFCMIWLFLFVPAFFFGGVFPLVNGLYIASRDSATKDTGVVYFWDTAGAIVGALICGFLLLPYFGLPVTIMTAVAFNLIICGMLPVFRYVLILLPVLIGVEFFVNDIQTDAKRFDGEISLVPPSIERYGTVLFEKESPFGTVRVFNKHNIRNIFINYRAMCSSTKDLMDSEELIAEIPILNVPDNAKILNIGLGCGATAYKALESDKVTRLDIAEINPVIVEANKRFFGRDGQTLFDDPRVRLFVRDGAEHLREDHNELYDAIIIDVEEVSVLHSAPFYTQEYFEIIKNKMTPDGVFALWSFNVREHDEFAKIMYNTARSVFPHVSMRFKEEYFLMVFASNEPFEEPHHKETEVETINRILQTDIDLINTIDNPIVEQYYDINAIFGLPETYRDPQARYTKE